MPRAVWLEHISPPLTVGLRGRAWPGRRRAGGGAWTCLHEVLDAEGEAQIRQRRAGGEQKEREDNH